MFYISGCTPADPKQSVMAEFCPPLPSKGESESFDNRRVHPGSKESS
jgi:hypothetical protein